MIPIDAYLHVDFWILLDHFFLYFLGGDEVVLHDVEAVQFLYREDVIEVLYIARIYIVQLFLSLENGLLRLVGRPKELTAGEFRQNQVQFKLGD